MSENSPQARTLKRAMDACGGLPALAKTLDVSVGDILLWLRGHAVPPTWVYIRALDLVAGTPPRPSKRRTQA